MPERPRPAVLSKLREKATAPSLTYASFARAGSFERRLVTGDFEPFYQQGKTMGRWFKKGKENTFVTLPLFPFLSFPLNLDSSAESCKCLLT